MPSKKPCSSPPGSLETFPEEVTHLIRSQCTLSLPLYKKVKANQVKRPCEEMLDWLVPSCSAILAQVPDIDCFYMTASAAI